jgi:hypothetical protein
MTESGVCCVTWTASDSTGVRRECDNDRSVVSAVSCILRDAVKCAEDNVGRIN